MLDRIGHELAEGDICVMPHKHGYVDLQIGRVTGFTPLNVRVEVFKRGDDEDHWQPSGPRMITPRGLVCITGEDALAFVLKNG